MQFLNFRVTFLLKLNQQQCTLKIILTGEVTTYLSPFESQVNSHLELCDLGSRREEIIMYHQKQGSIIVKNVFKGQNTPISKTEF